MDKAYRALLEKRIEVLNEKDFDFEVWKSGTVVLLNRIFGIDNAYSKEINAIKVDYSSWSLRDATSDYNPKEICKRSGRDVLELALAELDILATKKNPENDSLSLLQDNSGKLSEAVTNKNKTLLKKLLNKENKEDLVNSLTNLLIG